ncbi:MAG: hypothetical protein LQ342_004553 [Letrouitia transgressa]|nr:MAG: hypothetical protein LQ342_004553 [Letrouitia transgressa]
MSNKQHQNLDSDDKHPIVEEETKDPRILVRTRTSSSSSSGLSLKTPRTARFAEATSVNSPIDPTSKGLSPFADPQQLRTTHFMPQPQPSDVGLGYVADNQPSKHSSFVGVEVPLTPNSPLKSALKPPGTPGRLMNPLSPTFREEQILEKHEEKTDKANAKDLKIKTRVRMAKMCLRGVNFSCSLIVLSMISATFTIFNSTKNLSSRNNATPWAQNQQKWPQITLLCIAAVSLAMSIGILYAYWRGGHRRAEKAAVYYTVFAIGFFIFSIVIWSIGAAILSQSHNNGHDKDMWGWACKEGKRKELFKDEVDYGVVCRMQHWSLICAFIEIVVEVITIAIYGIVFYRFYSKRRLHKSMDLRDKARSDLYLAQLRSQSAPNTPGFQKTPMSPSFPSHLHDDDINDAENGYGTQYAQKHQSFSQPKPFNLQPPPIRIQNATPAVPQDGFVPAPQPQEHVPAAPGEHTYEAVPIPGAYASPLASPGFQVQSMNFGSTQPGQAYTTDGRVESPPTSPRLQPATQR